MAEYRRFISYIYAYEGDMKTKNVGFAKIEARGGQCRISISIKGAYESSGRELDLYGYGYLRDNFLLIPLGKVPIRNGVGEVVFGKREDDLGGSGFGLDFVKGLYLQNKASARKAYLTTWDDSIVHISSLRNASEAGKEWKREEPLLLKAAEAQAPEETEKQEPEPEQEPASMLESMEAALAVEPETGVELVTAAKPEAVKEEETASEPEPPVREREEGWDESFRGKMPDEFYYREGFMELPLWDCLRKVLPRKRILAEEGWEILQIQIQDIGRLPRENWSYGNNSFVLHGYYQYRYLILARRKRERQEKFQPEYQYILGVPGIFKPQEKFMASMFGLPDFKKAAGYREENFGFWCGSIQL